jgi:hypothetical protein
MQRAGKRIKQGAWPRDQGTKAPIVRRYVGLLFDQKNKNSLWDGWIIGAILLVWTPSFFKTGVFIIYTSKLCTSTTCIFQIIHFQCLHFLKHALLLCRFF